MIHKNYRNIFIQDLKANANDFDNEYKRIIEEYGQSNETKLQFYKATFKSIIEFYKQQNTDSEMYSTRITYCYNRFMNALKNDNIDVTDYIIESAQFTSEEAIKKYPWLDNKPTYTPTYKAYNPNTKYGRKKALEQAQRNYSNGSDEYRNDIDNIKIVVWAIVIIVAILFFFIKAKLSS